jgi:hypothetical protein
MTMKKIADMTTPEMLTEYNAITGKSVGKFRSRADGERLLAQARAEQHGEAAAPKGKFKTTRTAPPKEKDAPVSEDGQPSAPPQVEEPATEANSEAPTAQEASTTMSTCPKCGSTEKQEAKVVGDDIDETIHCGSCGTTYFADGTVVQEGKAEKPAKVKKERKPKEPKPPADPAETAKLRSASTRESWSKPGVHEARRKRDGVSVDGVQYKSVRDAFKALGLPDSKHVPFRKKLKAAGALGFEHEGKTTNFTIVKLEKAPKVKKAKDAPSTDASAPSA